ncbi:MAG TPA: nitric oxide synthase oxygenase, partial [Ktedonobacteraceae bacterium]|nr:nitric oxide synthase oxygenase [Ktedonobacteraceae bacterium]
MFGLETLFQKDREKQTSAHIPSIATQPLLEDPPQTTLLREADEYLRLFHAECGYPDETPARLAEIHAEIARTGTYQQTSAELTYGARLAWRQNTRCIGRLHWQTL